MPYELFMAFRYLRSRRKRRLARITTVIATLGIAIGVASLTVTLALANGFRDEMREKILRGTAHLSVMRADGQPIDNYRLLVARIERLDGVTDATGTTYDGAVIVGPRASAYAVLRGIDGESEQTKMEVERSLVEGSAAPIFTTGKEADLLNVILGAELATKIGVRGGDTAEIISTSGGGVSSIGPAKRIVRVAGLFRSGLFEYDSTWIYLSLDHASLFAGSQHSASLIGIQVKDIYDVKNVAAKVRGILGVSYTIVDWQEANRPLFTALALERRMGSLIIALLIFIAALNITTTLILVVVERRRDIAVLGAMGAKGGSIAAIFLAQGAMIGAVGALLGIILGTASCFLGNHYRIISLPADVYSITNVPFNSEPRDVLIAAFVALSLSLLATIYPAFAAARVRPVELLRDTQ